MQKIKNKIESIIKNTDKNNRHIFLKFFLSVLSVFYKFTVAVNNFLYKKKIRKIKKLPCFVISAGNITAGGTGKTPLVIYLAKLTQKLGYKPAIITRGYKGGYEKKGGVVSDGKKICANAEDAGDEPFMIAKGLKNIPVMAGKSRYKSGITAINKFGADIIILDDGFQHQKLFRNLNLLLLDYKKPFGNKRLLPRGILREPIFSVKRADAVILTRAESFNLENIKKITCAPVFKSVHIPFIIKNNKKISEDENFLKKKKAVIFSGIAQNKEFYRTVKNLDCFIKSFIRFEDHHKYIKKDFEKINNAAKNLDADIIITTEKDYVKIPADIKFFCELIIIGINIRFADDSPQNFDKLIEEKLKNDKLSNKTT
ncbi:MAG: tetraacyldisaccharide 4'-kinase [Deltaproteobacteria bacterium]|nr:tetraacyldisaccharide 4'-kinase [Deltaproteobacteria bacterium]